MDHSLSRKTTQLFHVFLSHSDQSWHIESREYRKDFFTPAPHNELSESYLSKEEALQRALELANLVENSKVLVYRDETNYIWEISL
jgi:hypothetical protein